MNCSNGLGRWAGRGAVHCPPVPIGRLGGAMDFDRGRVGVACLGLPRGLVRPSVAAGRRQGADPRVGFGPAIELEGHPAHGVAHRVAGSCVDRARPSLVGSPSSSRRTQERGVSPPSRAPSSGRAIPCVVSSAAAGTVALRLHNSSRLAAGMTVTDIGTVRARQCAARLPSAVSWCGVASTVRGVD